MQTRLSMTLGLCLTVAIVTGLRDTGEGLPEEDPCKSYTLWTDSHSVFSTSRLSKPPYRGHFVLRYQWYRFSSPAGNDLATSCVERNRCSTQFPLWMDSPIPGQDSREHTFIMRMTYKQGTTFCRRGSKPVRPRNGEVPLVKNCGAFRVYKLPPSPLRNSGYCIGNKVKCPAGQWSETGFHPGCGPYIRLTATPTIEVSLDWTAPFNMITRFTCKLNQPGLPVGHTFDTRWYISKAGRSRPLEPRTSTIFESQLPDLFNYDLSCQMRAWHQLPTWAPSPYVHSNKFFVGIQMEPKIITLSPDQPRRRVTLTATIPVLCRRRNCRLPLHLFVDNNIKEFCDTEQALFGLTDCVAYIPGLNMWDAPRTQQTHFDIESGSGRTVYANKDSAQVIALFKTPHWREHPMWSEKKAPILPVRVLPDRRNPNLPASICSSSNDPRMTTFDRCKYDNNEVGEFIMYRNRRFGTQVNAFTRPCWAGSSVTCNCGVAVLSGVTQHWILDRCSSNPTEHRLALLRCDDDLMRIRERNTNSYEIELRVTGTIIDITLAGTNNIGISIKPSTKDISFSEGLCGNLDAIASNDLYNRITKRRVSCPNTFGSTTEELRNFVKSWRVQPNSDESLWNEYQVPSTSITYQLCGCNEQIGGNVATCNNNPQWKVQCASLGTDVTEKTTNQCYERNARRRKRAANGESDYDELRRPPFVVKETTYQEPKWRNGWTRQTAQNKCKEAIEKSTAGKACKGYNVDFNIAVEECIQDIKASGGTDWVEGAVKAMVVSCENQIMRNMTTWRPQGGHARSGSSAEKGKLQPQLFVLNSLCPEDCSGHGHCNRGECECNEPYAGEACKVNLNTAPNISSTVQHCDLSKRPCRAVTVFGNTFIDSDRLKCKVAISELTLEGNRNLGTTIRRAEHIENTKVMCPLPEEPVNSAQGIGRSYTISVSNNNRAFSSSVSVLAYDAGHAECTVNGCQIK